ncbi:uncharacterized protein LOC126630322 [Malus sylvestris]|uniref:uncharacterized protein LOC126630322 n=1 Tax=Malus sylvestris TaxID=3752 RepID=UPI0021AC665D|nr:uncharacterized protein LOC126630322 [Malus sylvestris]
MSRNGKLGRKGVGQSSMADNGDSVWRDIWRLKVPPKLCHFVWKGCRNILAVRTNLQRQGIRLETSCPFCEDVTMVVGVDFLECRKWLFAKYGKDGEACDLMRWVVGGLWRIWKCRNSLVFEKVEVKPLVAIQLLKQQWEELKVCEEA